MKEKMFGLFSRMFLSKKMMLAMLVLRLLFSASSKEKKASVISSVVYEQLPEDLKPKGKPAEKRRVMKALANGNAFVTSLNDLDKK